MRHRALVTPLVALCAAACATTTAPRVVDDLASFELGLSPWYAVAMDTGQTGGAHATWTIERSDAHASAGAWSARLNTMNATDAVKLWLERGYVVAPSPNDEYDVTIAFDFGTFDFGTINHWRIIAGAFAHPPRSATALEPAFRGETGGAPGPGTLRWLEKSYSTRVTAARGKIYVTLGVWGTFETERTYFIDDVRVTIRPAPATP